MKGVIVSCLQKLVTEKFGLETWHKSLEDSGINRNAAFLPTSEIDDHVVMAIIQSVCANLDITLTEAADAFGEYWVHVYSQNLYSGYYASNRTAIDFLLEMDTVHTAMTKKLKDARPPRFSYDWEDEHTLIIHYHSHRGLIDFVVGLVKGVGSYYHEELLVTKDGPDRVRVVFQQAHKKSYTTSLKIDD